VKLIFLDYCHYVFFLNKSIKEKVIYKTHFLINSCDYDYVEAELKFTKIPYVPKLTTNKSLFLESVVVNSRLLIIDKLYR